MSASAMKSRYFDDASFMPGRKSDKEMCMWWHNQLCTKRARRSSCLPGRDDDIAVAHSNQRTLSDSSISRMEEIRLLVEYRNQLVKATPEQVQAIVQEQPWTACLSSDNRCDSQAVYSAGKLREQSRESLLGKYFYSLPNTKKPVLRRQNAFRGVASRRAARRSWSEGHLLQNTHTEEGQGRLRFGHSQSMTSISAAKQDPMYGTTEWYEGGWEAWELDDASDESTQVPSDVAPSVTVAEEANNGQVAVAAVLDEFRAVTDEFANLSVDSLDMDGTGHFAEMVAGNNESCDSQDCEKPEDKGPRKRPPQLSSVKSLQAWSPNVVASGKAE